MSWTDSLLGMLYRRPASRKPRIERACTEVLESRLLLATYVVTSDVLGGAGGLLDALGQAARNPGLDTIEFNIGQGGAQSILLTQTVRITSEVIIDGRSQPGYVGKPLIELHGDIVEGTDPAIVVEADGCTIRGLIINKTPNGGIGIDSTGNTISGNYIGTDATGTYAVPNYGPGIRISASGNTIGYSVGSVEDMNIIGGNTGDGILIQNSSSVGNTIRGNRIGVGLGGEDLGNGGAGIRIENSELTSIEGNVISRNGAGGVVVVQGAQGGLARANSISGNTIFDNIGLGIDLGGDGLTPNDADDSDPGANDLQNAPVLAFAGQSATGITVTGSLTSAPNTTFNIEVFASASADPTGFGEGERVVGGDTVTTDASGIGSFSILIPGEVPISLDEVITATATDDGGNTSEFSNAVYVTEADLSGSGNAVIAAAGHDTGPTQVATFTDTRGDSAAGDFTATIDWGDDSATSTGTVRQVTLGQFEVLGSHTYATPNAAYPITITIRHDDGRTLNVQGAASVLADEITFYGVPIIVNVGQDVTTTENPIGGFLDARGGTVEDYSVLVDWGDGSEPSAGTLEAQGDGRTFLIHGSHVYARTGQYDVKLTLATSDDRSAEATSMAIVTEDDLLINTVPITGTAGVALKRIPIGSVVDFRQVQQARGELSAAAAAFTATVDWGDGTSPSEAILQPLGEQAYMILGNHTYRQGGTFNVTIVVSTDDERRATATTTATIEGVEPTVIEAQGVNVAAMAGIPTARVRVAIFTDGRSDTRASDYTAQIDWGNGRTSSGLIVRQGNGRFSVLGQTLYEDDGIFDVNVSISGNDASAETESRAHVAGVPRLAMIQQVTAKANRRLTRPIFSFIDINPLRKAGDFSAEVRFGDGSSGRGTVRRSDDGRFEILADHAYRKRGKFNVVVKITDKGGRSEVYRFKAVVA